jgi:hypothetical protein
VAKIQFVCASAHIGADASGPDGPTITIHEGGWAYCLRGATADHTWQHIEPMSVEAISIAAQRRSVTAPARG